VNEQQSKQSDTEGIYGPVKEDFIRQPLKNPETSFKDAMLLLSQDEWLVLHVNCFFFIKIFIFKKGKKMPRNEYN
jgi:hypothetical protein